MKYLRLENEASFEDFVPEMKLWDDEDVAFIKNDIDNGRWIVCSADGEEIASTSCREFAFIIAKQNEFKPSSAH